MLKSDTSKKIANNTVYQFLGKFVSMTFTVIATMIITRFYGRDGYGQFNLMQNFPALFFIISDFGFNAVATKHLSEKWGDSEKYLNNILSIRILLSVILIAVSAVSLIYLPYSSELRFGITLGLLTILTQSLYATTNIIFQVKLRYDLSVAGSVLGSVVTLVLVLLTSFFHSKLVWVNFSYVIGGFVSFFILVAFLRKLNVKINLSWNTKLWRQLLITSLPLGLMFIFSQINFKADSILISLLSLPKSLGFNSNDSVALYGLPYKVFEVSLVVPTFFMNSVYPVMVVHMIESKDKLKQIFLKSLQILFFAGIVIGILGYIFSPLAIKILGGNAFLPSIYVLRVLLGGVIIFYITQPIAWLIVTLGKPIYLPFIYLTSAVFNVVANFLFIPKYSFYASAHITWISELLILIMLSVAARRAWKLKYA